MYSKMIIMVCLINIHLHMVTDFYLMMITFRI